MKIAASLLTVVLTHAFFHDDWGWNGAPIQLRALMSALCGLLVLTAIWS